MTPTRFIVHHLWDIALHNVALDKLLTSRGSSIIRNFYYTCGVASRVPLLVGKKQRVSWKKRCLVQDFIEPYCRGFTSTFDSTVNENWIWTRISCGLPWIFFFSGSCGAVPRHEQQSVVVRNSYKYWQRHWYHTIVDVSRFLEEVWSTAFLQQRSSRLL